jgi:hypothetical protein
MELPNPHRYAFFPPSQIFGRKMVPMYYHEEAPMVPLASIAEIVGVPLKAVISLARKNLGLAPLVDMASEKPIASAADLDKCQHSACVGMEGISLLLFGIDPDLVTDPDARQRLQTAKLWMAVQVSNRLKKPGRRNQPRWDAGLNKHQAHLLKEHFAKLNLIKK